MFGSSSSIQLARVLGIRIGVNLSWFLVLFLIIWLLQDAWQGPFGDANLAFIGAVIGAFLYFGSIALHELGHALAARRVGIDVEGIDLFFFGGVMKMSRDTDTPGREFVVAAAGPAVTLVLSVAAFAVGVTAFDQDAFLAAFPFGATDSLAVTLVSLVASLNAALLVFNLIPAFPLDGGRLARALVWKLTNSRTRATRISATAGQIFAGGFVLLGAFIALTNPDRWFDGVWLAVLGLMLGQSARAAVVASSVTQHLEGVIVADVMDREPVTIAAGTPVMTAFEDYFLRYHGWNWFAVVEDDGRFVGLAHRAAVEHAAVHEASAAPVRDVVATGAAAVESIRADAPLEAALGSEALRRFGALMAVYVDGRLRGVLTVEQVARALRPPQPAAP